MSTLLIVDSHALIHRAYHAIPPLTRKDGTPTNAIYGYFSMLQKTIIDLKPSHIAAAFDTPTESFRKKIITTYQATRKPTEDNLKVQFNLVKDVLDSTGIKRFETPGYEADDTIGTLAVSMYNATQDQPDPPRIIILTGDKDMFQLVNNRIYVLTPQIGFSKSVLYTPELVREKLGVYPDKVADLKALMGDSSDHYAGLKNIGPKTAAKLIDQYGSTENMSGKFDEETMSTLKQMKEVATIVTDLPSITVTLEDLRFDGFPQTFKQKLQEYELYSLINRFFPHQKAEKQKQSDPKPAEQDGLF
ncbi:MAG: 5'-3' exonuclease H3TH domain-containing protein [Candidatus Roizmanbacteria bacterium]